MTTMTFKQFQATRVRCDDLGTALSDATLTDLLSKGFLYLSQPPNEQGYTGGLWIEDDDPNNHPDSEAHPWRLVLGDDEEVTSDLAGLERRLYQFAIAEGYIEPDRFAAALESLVTAAAAVLEQWDDSRVPAGAYPAYLPSFDEFVTDLVDFRDAVERRRP